VKLVGRNAYVVTASVASARAEGGIAAKETNSEHGARRGIRGKFHRAWTKEEEGGRSRKYVF
jgi:hypothetical protein